MTTAPHDWVVGDSEGEEEVSVSLPQQVSTISQFPTIPLEQESPISAFLSERPQQKPSALQSSIIVSTSSASPLKPPQAKAGSSHERSSSKPSEGLGSIDSAPEKRKQPRPRPAYGKHKKNSGSAAETGPEVSTSLNISADVFNDISLPIGRNQPSSSNRNRSSSTGERRRVSSNRVISLSSDDETLVKNSNISSASMLPPSDPSTSIGAVARPRETTPLSSPINVKKRKRVITHVEEDSIVVAASALPSEANVISLNKQKQDRKRKKAGDGETGVDRPRTKAPSTKKRKSNAKDVAAQQEFKSNEFVDTSDDDLNLLPSLTSAGQQSHSDPASALYPVPLFADVSMQDSSAFQRPDSVHATVSVLPSLQGSVRPSESVSVPKSAPISAPAPPSSPVAAPRKAKAATKQKKQVKEPSSAVDDFADTSKAQATDLGSNAGAFVSTSSLSSAPDAEPKEAKMKGKKGKQAVDVVLPVLKKTARSEGQLDKSKDAASPQKGAPKTKAKRGRKQAAILSSDEDEPSKDEPPPCSSKQQQEDKEAGNRNAEGSSEANKENKEVEKPPAANPQPPVAPTTMSTPREPRRHSLPVRKDSMSALIRRVSSKVNSPLASPAPGFVHSPLAKASREMLRRIAPLHPNRRTPPPAPPRPPPPKKSKKMLALEEKWEEELAEGVEGWACMADEERAALRRAKRDAELGYDD